MKITKHFFNHFRKSINPPYNVNDLPVLLGLFIFLALVMLTAVLMGQPRDTQSLASVGIEDIGDEEFVSNEVLVRLKDKSTEKIKEGAKPENIGIESLEEINKELEVDEFEPVIPEGTEKKDKDEEVFDWYRVKLPEEKVTIKGEFNQETSKIASSNPKAKDLQKVIDTFKEDPNVEAVEPNFVVKILATPNDPYFPTSGAWGQSYLDLYGMHNIDVDLAWDQTTGSNTIIVADIDTGVDRNHPDIAANMWVNSGETPNNGVDDDGNGYIDDYNGWDWYNNDNDPMDDHGHGTHTVGTIAAVGNNSTGVVGVNWTSRIMALKFLGAGGSGYLSDGIAALQYAADNGAHVSSNSWGCSCNSFAMDDAIKYEHDRGMVVAVAAGNSNGDTLNHSPASSDHAIAVAATDNHDNKASFSNYGQKIDVAAPGVNILSLKASTSPMCTASRTVGTQYCRVSGTSMATPHVAGLAALLLANNPTLSNEEVRQIIRHGADDIGTTGKDIFYGYGRINAKGSMDLSLGSYLAPIISSPRTRGSISGSSVNIVGGVSGPDFTSYKVEAGKGRNPSSWTTLINSTTQVNSGTLVTFNSTTLTDGDYIFRVTATASDSKKYQFQVHDIEVDNNQSDTTPPLAPSSLKLKIISNSRVDLTWSASSDNVGVSGYRIYRNNVLRRIQSGRIYADTTIKTGIKYTYYVRAYDAEGNLSAKSNLVSVTINVGAPKKKLGDVNGDGSINIRDLSILLSRWKQTHATSDLNSDGKIDIRDLSILLSRWGR